MPLSACNRGYNSFELRAELDIQFGNCHTCDIHFAISAFQFSNEKGPRKGRNEFG
jgi:hypothetical protein